MERPTRRLGAARSRRGPLAGWGARSELASGARGPTRQAGRARRSRALSQYGKHSPGNQCNVYGAGRDRVRFGSESGSSDERACEPRACLVRDVGAKG